MKKFGFIYKYNPSERMGILVFGVWKDWKHRGSTIKNTPIIFYNNNLLSEVKTGQLVFFDLDGKTASNIEPASLSNFKVEYINSLIRCQEEESEFSFYQNNTFISFEYLNNIIIPNENKLSDNTKNFPITYDGSLPSLEELFKSSDNDKDKREQVKNDSDDDLLFLRFCDSPDSYYNIEFDSITHNETINRLPKSIKELFNCFGKYKHKDRKKSTSLNVFDLSLWADSEVLSTEYYGKKVDEILFLYDLFVLKNHYDKNGNKMEVKLDNNCISPMWSLLLSKFSEDDLKEIISKAPRLQPALPVDFCKKYTSFLTEDYGMPNVEICKLYCIHKIQNAKTVSDYNEIKHKLYVYYNCGATHLEGEGTPMCKMGKTSITNLQKRLEEQYENVIKKNILAQFSVLSEDSNVVNELANATSDEFNNIGLFFENYNTLKHKFLEYYDLYDKVFDSYYKLSKLYQDALKTSLINCINESAISATQSDYLSPFMLSYQVNKFGNLIFESTKQRIKELVNNRFSKLEDLEELMNAYKADYITSQQYCSKYEQITSNYNTYQFLDELHKLKDSPIEIQWYVVSTIIDQLGYESLNSYKYIKIEYLDSICDIRSLLKWLASYGNLNDIVLKKAEDKICSVLSNDERWTLFEEKIVQSPGIENIREQLNKVYKNKRNHEDISNKELLKRDCFQDAMLSDIDSIKDSRIQIFIADNLDSKHLYLMQLKTTGFLNLYLWQKQPSEFYDWDLIKTYFSELPADAQIRVLRFMFSKMASRDFPLSLDDLYSEFVETTTPACSAICGILFMLKAKKNDMNVSITPAMLESVFGEEENQRFSFLNDSMELFYPCNGYIAISANRQDTEYLSFYGILTQEIKNNELYFVIYFYESPVDSFEKTIDYLMDSEYVEIAKEVLLKNTYVEVINGKYYIHKSHEFFVKQFVIAYHIDDRCGLVSDPRVHPLYTNYIRKYEDSDNYICRGGSFGGSDPKQNNIPFFWCNKKMCVRRAHFLLPPSKWENYRFADLLFIVLGQSPDVRESVWRVNAEISQFICDYKKISKLNDRNIHSKPLDEIEERGIWDESSSIYRKIYDEEFDEEYEDEYEEEYEDYISDYDEPTYNRYNGSYAQDNMGYSDDDIDIIFDGDPDAYWNID